MSVTHPQSGLPFYFGPADKRLFGCYHEPSSGRKRKCAVVISEPMGHEYIYCHRALRQLAVRLCEAGFPVLRFDFYGCGDSAGNVEDATLVQWLQDLSNAIAEVRMRANAGNICLMGIRLGGALSLALACERNDIDGLVLWDPVIVGKTYLRDLYAIQKQACTHRRRPMRHAYNDDFEICGFSLPKALREELEEMNLPRIAAAATTRILDIQTHTTEDTPTFKAHLTAHKVSYEYQEITAPKIWEPTVDGNLLVPNQILRSIVSWTSRTQA